MMERIQEGIWYIRMRFSGAKKPGSVKKPAPSRARLRGNMRAVIMVKPDDPMFEQAFFILSDSCIRTGDEANKLLLRQAREAAAGYTDRLVPRGRKRGEKLVHALVMLALGAALGLIISQLM